MKYLILLSLFLTLACSKIETGLRFAPRIATSKIDDAFDFDSDKLTKIRKQIDADIQNSKKELALKIIAHLDSLQKHSEDPNLNLEKIASFYDEISETQTSLMNSFKTSAEVVFKDLSEHEIKNFKEYSDKKYSEESDLTKDKPAFIKKKKQTFVKNYEIFFGSLSLEQEKILTSFIEKNFTYFTDRIKERQKFSEEFYFKIKSKDPVLDFFLGHYEGKKYSEIKDPAMKDYLKQFFLMQIAFWKTTDAKQRTYLQKTIASYREQLQKIARP